MTTNLREAPPHPPDAGSRARVQEIIEFAGNLLPLPGPITAFAFLNTLQALEDLPFDSGMQKGAELYGCQPYLNEDRYRAKLARGRIQMEDLSAVLRKDLEEQADEGLRPSGTRYDLRLAMLQYPMRLGPVEELRWFVAETDALTRFRQDAPPMVRERFVEQTRRWAMRDMRTEVPRTRHEYMTNLSPRPRDRHPTPVLSDLLERFGAADIEQWSDRTWDAFSLQALWRVCKEGVDGLPSIQRPDGKYHRHRDLLFAACDHDSDGLVHEVLIRFCAAYADQGFANWSLPKRADGFYKAFYTLYGQPGGPPDRWAAGLAAELQRLERTGTDPLGSILESLWLLGVPESQWHDFLMASLLALRGWAGLLWHMELRPDRFPFPTAPGTLAEFLAVRLILDRLALAYVAREWLGYDGPLDRLCDAAGARIPRRLPSSVEQRAFLVFQLAQVLDWCPPDLYRLTRQEWAALIGEIECFPAIERRRVFHLAFERRFRMQALDALSIYTARPANRPKAPRFQAVFCLDAREESFRRHLEECAPDTETFGAAGFFSVPIFYRGSADAHFVGLCPIVVMPQHWVVEDVVYTFDEAHRRRAKTRRTLGTAFYQVHLGSRDIASGALLAAGLGFLASIPLVARVLFPRLTARIRRNVGRFVQAPPMTRLRLERKTAEPGPQDDAVGFTVDEMANTGERVLRDIGLISGFARLVMFLGHGSFCLNNPHKSAYDCGACSGSAGGPNARALAAILNDVRVRKILADRGLAIPAETVFLGGLHNTCVDSLTFFDLDLLPKSHFGDFEAARDTLAAVCERNAHERCRRFESAPLNLSFEAAHRHVEQRSEDLAQTRPEYGNSTNALCIVGRRARARGLFLDRRSFMHSYDATQDDADGTILGRILAAVVPVCEGINMQYFLSAVDSTGWACGSKLPHNVTSLLGVMDGMASDLRPGLPWQGVDIHEPVRLLFIVETTPAVMIKIMDRIEIVGRILRNGWAQLALLDAESNEVQVFRGGEFHLHRPENSELPTAASSVDWYRGWRDHLGFAAIEVREPREARRS